jgi:hypothetical protein
MDLLRFTPRTKKFVQKFSEICEVKRIKLIIFYYCFIGCFFLLTFTMLERKRTLLNIISCHFKRRRNIIEWIILAQKENKYKATLWSVICAVDRRIEMITSSCIKSCCTSWWVQFEGYFISTVLTKFHYSNRHFLIQKPWRLSISWKHG